MRFHGVNRCGWAGSGSKTGFRICFVLSEDGPDQLRPWPAFVPEPPICPALPRPNDHRETSIWEVLERVTLTGGMIKLKGKLTTTFTSFCEVNRGSAGQLTVTLPVVRFTPIAEVTATCWICAMVAGFGELGP